MLLDALNLEMAASSEPGTFYARIVVRTDENLILDYCNPMYNKDYLEITAGKFLLMYRPRNDRPKYQGKPYVLVMPQGITVRRRYVDWADFCSECEHEPQLRWLKKWSNLNEQFFAMAKRNIGLMFPILIHLVEYEQHLQEVYRERFGEDPGDRALLCSPYEGEASAIAEDKYNNQLYRNNIETKLSKYKKGDK